MSLLPVFAAVLILTGCSSPDEAQKQRVLRENARGEYLHQKSGQQTFALPTPQLQPPPAYPWEEHQQQAPRRTS
ncbi:MAG: hypothetical protein ACOYKZ_00615 [Chlamydiia bacterium]